MPSKTGIGLGTERAGRKGKAGKPAVMAFAVGILVASGCDRVHWLGALDAGGGSTNDGGRPDAGWSEAGSDGSNFPEAAAGGDGGSAPTTGTLTLLAGGSGTSVSVDGVGANARFSALSVIAFDGAGSLYAVDGLAIRRVVLATGEVTTLVQDNPQMLVADGLGNVYYTRTPYSHVVKKLDLASGTATVLAGSASCGEACGTSDGVGTQALLNRPAGLALDGGGKMFVAEAGGEVIRMVDLATANVTTLAGTAGKVGLADGVGMAALFWQPWGLALDASGNLYVNDSYNDTLRKIVLATREVTTLTTSGFVSSSGSSEVVKLQSVNAMTVDRAGNLYVAVGDVVQKIVPGTGEMTTVVGAIGQTGVTLGPLPASLTRPSGLAALPDGRLLIASDNMILVATF